MYWLSLFCNAHVHGGIIGREIPILSLWSGFIGSDRLWVCHTRRVCELASGLTRNQMPSNGLRVRIPCPPLTSLYYYVPFRSDRTFCLESGKSYLLVSSGGEWLSVRSITRGSRDVRSLIRSDALPASRSSMRSPTTSARQPVVRVGGASSCP